MAKPPQLPPGVTLYSDTNGQKKFWRVRLGKRFISKSERPQKLAFKTQAMAVKFIKDENEKRYGNPEESKKLGLTELQVKDAKLALHKLGDKGTLLEAVESWLRIIEPFKDAPTVGKAIEQLLEHKKDEELTGRHERELKAKLTKIFKGLESKKIDEVSLEDMRKAQGVNDATGNKPTPQQRIKRMRYAAILFNFAIERNWIAETRSPLRGIAKPKAIPKVTEKFSVNEVAKILWAAQEHYPRMLVPLAIKIFAGIRNPELFGLKWEAIVEDSVVVLATFAKTQRQRSVTIQKPLKAWIQKAIDLKAREEADIAAEAKGKPKSKAPPKGPPPTMKGLVFAETPESGDREASWLEQIHLIKLASGVSTWPQNILRSTFGSYHYQLVKNEAVTAYEMGNSPSVVRRHYVNAVTEKACKAFWDLTPARVEVIMNSTPPDPSAPPPSEIIEHHPEEDWVEEDSNLQITEVAKEQPSQKKRKV